jgi:hypothetical protein
MIIGILGVFGLLRNGSHGLTPGWSLVVLVPAALIFMMLAIGDALARTVLFTGTRQGAPTFWQRNRAGIIIAVVVAAAFYLLGLLTAHA